MDLIIRQQQVLHDKKWFKFLSRARLFRHIPFIDFVFGAGSLATGRVLPDSDFDVIVGVKSGHIFTTRFLSILVFGLFGWRRKRLSHSEAARDRICLNHFVTPAAYRLAAPHTDSWRELYKNLVPVWGEEEKINAFWAANADWIDNSRDPLLHFNSSLVIARPASGGSWQSQHPSLRGTPKQSYYNVSKDDLRYLRTSASRLKLKIEAWLGGPLGDSLERLLKRLQLAKIQKSLAKDPAGHKPRLRYDDTELEFHPDRKKFEN